MRSWASGEPQQAESRGAPGALGRRSVLLGAAAALASSAMTSTAAFARPVENYKDFGGETLPFPMVGGSQAAEETENSIAGRIIRRAPKSSPFAIMRYFEHLRRVNKDNEAYNGGWSTRWNPIIVQFFEETATTPEGDTTSWCAASLNWALARAGLKGGTHSASSGSFRDSPGLTRRPRRGDIVVFGATDKTAFEQGHGHVGLFVAQRRNAVLVLGGNQKNPQGHHAFCRKWLDKSGTDLKLHSFHHIGAFA
jgi:uncharacterized protein (TIGR02594 family)